MWDWQFCQLPGCHSPDLTFLTYRKNKNHPFQHWERFMRFKMKGRYVNVSAFIISLLPLALQVAAQNTTSPPPERSAGRIAYSRAVDAAVWGMPIVSFDAT